jgi:hypothetical protein
VAAVHRLKDALVGRVHLAVWVGSRCCGPSPPRQPGHPARSTQAPLGCHQLTPVRLPMSRISARWPASDRASSRRPSFRCRLEPRLPGPRPCPTDPSAEGTQLGPRPNSNVCSMARRCRVNSLRRPPRDCTNNDRRRCRRLHRKPSRASVPDLQRPPAARHQRLAGDLLTLGQRQPPLAPTAPRRTHPATALQQIRMTGSGSTRTW